MIDSNIKSETYPPGLLSHRCGNSMPVPLGPNAF